jgi:H+/gluconate symporter-like permease
MRFAAVRHTGCTTTDAAPPFRSRATSIHSQETHMNLRQVAVLLGATAAVIGEARRALVGLERTRHASVSGSLPALFLVGAGVAMGAVVAQPAMRRRIGAWLMGVSAPAPVTPAPAPSVEASVEAPRPQPYANGA